MPEILWFGLGTIPDHEHEPRARVLSESRTRQFSGSRSRVTNNGFSPSPLDSNDGDYGGGKSVSSFILLPLSLLSEIRARLFAFFQLSALIIHPCLNAPESAGLVNPVQFCDLAKRVIHSTNYGRRTQMVGKIELRTLDKSDTQHDVGVH